jgi:hypothetical protein
MRERRQVTVQVQQLHGFPFEVGPLQQVERRSTPIRPAENRVSACVSTEVEAEIYHC